MANSTLQQNVNPSIPHLQDLLDLHKKSILLDFNAHHIGTIQKFNSSSQTADVSINYKKTFFDFNADTGVYDSRLVDYPLLAQIPVVVLGGGPGSLTFPIAAGDECLVLFNDRDLDNWFSGSSSSANATLRLHSFSDGVALVGIRSMANVLSSYDSTRVVLQNGTTLVGVGASLIKIANNTTTLNTLLQSLITQLGNLVDQTALITVSSFGAPPNNAAAITAIGTQLMSIGMQIGQLLE